ncbi:MHYT domain-containing protein [Nocardia sp. NPDC003482]
MILDVHHFSYGWLTPGISYVMSFTGCLLGLQCAARGRVSPTGRSAWLASAAVAIGGTGIWVMHFVAMLGFSIQNAPIRYDVVLTTLSAVVAIVVVWIGLRVVARPRPSLAAMLAGGVITGLGVAAMHYMGMAAMKSTASVSYDPVLVAVSVLIAVVAATAALWFTLRIDGILATLLAASVMAVAVSGMHYTGMASMHAHDNGEHKVPMGADALQLFGPLVTIIGGVTILLLVAVGLTPIERGVVELEKGGGERSAVVSSETMGTRYWPTTATVRSREAHPLERVDKTAAEEERTRWSLNGQ